MTVKMPTTSRAYVKTVLADSEEDNSEVENEEVIHNEDETDSDDGNVEENDVKDDVEDEEAGVQETDGDDEEDESEDEEMDEDEGSGNVNAGWANSIAKILKTTKPKKKKTLVLSKAKKLSDLQKEKPKSAGFQVERPDGEIQEEHIEVEAVKQVKDGPSRKKKRDILSVRIKPNILEKDRERLLSKIATKGVVQLFNAVKQQQKDIKTKLDQAGPLEVRRDKVLKSIDKRSFLDHLMGDKSKSVEVGNQLTHNDSKDNRTTWNVLRDDFMMGSNKMKDWDRQLEGEDETEEQMEVELEMESD